MTTTVTDDITGVTVHTGASDIEPGKVNVAIYGPSRELVQQCIFDLAEEYDNVTFTNPSPVGPRRFGAMGRVW